jgi:hypothetical protein
MLDWRSHIRTISTFSSRVRLDWRFHEDVRSIVRRSSRELETPWSVALQTRVCFFAGLTGRPGASSCVALPLRLPTLTSKLPAHSAHCLPTLCLAQHARHAHRHQALPRLASRSLTCRRSLRWQQCQGTVVHAGSHSSASWQRGPRAAANPRSAAPLSISTSLVLITARTSKRSEAILPPCSPPCTLPFKRPAPAHCCWCAWPSSISTAPPAPARPVCSCIRFFYLLPNCVLVLCDPDPAWLHRTNTGPVSNRCSALLLTTSLHVASATTTTTSSRCSCPLLLRSLTLPFGHLDSTQDHFQDDHSQPRADLGLQVLTFC